MPSALHSSAFSCPPIADGLGLALVATALDAGRIIILPRSGLVGERIGGRMILRRPARAA